MKTLLLRLAILFATLGGRAFAAEPPVTFSVDPEEAGKVIYAPMGAVSANDPPTGRLWFSVNIANNSASSLTLTNIRVQMTGIDISIPQDLECSANKTTARSLADDEIITVPHPAPAAVTFRLYFAGNPTPKTIQRFLVPYVPATHNGQYLYPADEGDIGPDEYFSDGPAHGPGGQMWGADWKVYRVISQGDTSTYRAGSDESANADSLGWGVPIRAIADGVVLRTTSDYVNNPVPGKLAFQKMSEYDGEAISDVKVTRLGSTRAASLQRLPSGNVQLSIWETAKDGRQLTRLGSSGLRPSETVLDMALDELSSKRVVGALRLANDNLRIVVWDISTNGMNVTNMWSVDRGGVSEVSLTRMSSSRFATGVRNASGNLQINVWDVSDAGIQPLATNTAGAATSICTTTLSGTRLATSLRTAQGALKVIVWDLVGDGPYTLERRGEATGEGISRVAATRSDSGKWVTAYRSSGGSLKLARWFASESGLTLTSELETTAHAIENNALDIAPAKGIHAVTASIVAGGAFQINGWRNDPEDSPNSYQFHADNTAGAVNAVSLDELDTMEYLVGVRTAGGALKIMTWHYANGGGNSVVMLHGNCRVLYAHFQEGSVNTNVLYPGATVAAGQMLGRMGHSGSSGAPHTHINSDRIDDSRSIEQIIADEAEFARTDDISKLGIIGPRPMPFSGARAMQLSQIAPGGEGNPANSFATMNGHGMYDVSLGIRPRLNTRYLDRNSTGLNATGRKEVLPAVFLSTGGPFHNTVAQAVGAVSAGTRLYVRGGTYNEAITLDRPMTIRRYDYYRTAGSVVINP